MGDTDWASWGVGGTRRWAGRAKRPSCRVRAESLGEERAWWVGRLPEGVRTERARRSATLLGLCRSGTLVIPCRKWPLRRTSVCAAAGALACGCRAAQAWGVGSSLRLGPRSLASRGSVPGSLEGQCPGGPRGAMSRGPRGAVSRGPRGAVSRGTERVSGCGGQCMICLSRGCPQDGRECPLTSAFLSRVTVS